jgi:hypothetical protein
MCPVVDFSPTRRLQIERCLGQIVHGDPSFHSVLEFGLLLCDSQYYHLWTEVTSPKPQLERLRICWKFGSVVKIVVTTRFFMKWHWLESI